MNNCICRGLFYQFKARILQIRRHGFASKFDAKLVQDHWEAKGQYLADTTGTSSNEEFKMILPPPNVTGNLHIGHALTVAIEDSICRYNRLLGRKVRWIPGFDHAGIATQNVVERQIYRKSGKRREDFTKEEFLQQCEAWKDERMRDITNQLNSLGCSLDWQDLFYTMDKKFTKAVKLAFCRLYEMGIIVRETRLVQVVGENEPILKEQWFLHLDEMNNDLLGHLDSEKLHLDPPTIRGNFVDFLKFKEPWCLSRQLLWGHKIPAYFVEDTKRWVVAISEEEARQKLTENELNCPITQDTDVLDTWFSSSLIPIVVAGWPDKEAGKDVLDLMETGHDIIGFWVAKMLMVCQRLTGHYPFSNVLVHGLIQDSQNRKMSKSLGNVIDPMDVINGISLEQMLERLRTSNVPTEEIANAELDLRKRFPKGVKACGADALRFALFRHDLTDFQIKMDIPKFAEEGLRFCNKVWNLCKYVEKVSTTNGEIAKESPKTVFETTEEDERIRNECRLIVQQYSYHMQRNRPHLAFDRLYKFILRDLCDNYLESTKQSLWQKDPHRLPEIAKSLEEVTSISLHLLQTFMPFLCTFLLDTLKLDGQKKATEILREFSQLTNEEHARLADDDERRRNNDIREMRKSS